MMARESHPEPVHRPLSEETLHELRIAIAGHTRNAPDADDALRTALARVTAEARARSLRVEEVIVAFKKMWSTMPELSGGPTRADEIAVRERLVTMCIKAYYSP